MVNKVILIGNLGRDPEIRSTPSGQSVATFSIATNRKWNDRDGNRREETEWHNIELWGRQAETAGQYLRKGSRIYIEGRIKTESWEDKNTQEKKYKTIIVGQFFQMLSGRDDSPGRGYGSSPSQSSDVGEGQSQGPGPSGSPDDDIPF